MGFIGAKFLARLVVEFIEFHLCVFGNIDQYCPRSSRAGNKKALGNGRRNICCPPHLEVPLGRGHGNSHHIGFLKCICSQKMGSYLTCNADQRRAIYLCIGQTCNQIGGSRARGGQTYAHLSRNSCIALSGMDGSLFVSSEHVFDLILVVI